MHQPPSPMMGRSLVAGAGAAHLEKPVRVVPAPAWPFSLGKTDAVSAWLWLAQGEDIARPIAGHLRESIPALAGSQLLLDEWS